MGLFEEVLKKLPQVECPRTPIMISTKDPNDTPHVRFERPLDARVMAVDGTSSNECLLVQISEAEAQVDLAAVRPNSVIFF